MNISFITFGCKANHYDTDQMIAASARLGLVIVPPNERSDICVINTCTVTSSADIQARNMVRRLIKRNPGALIIVCGCSTQIGGMEFQKIEGVDYILGVNAEKGLINILNKHFKLSGQHIDFKSNFTTKIQDRARGYLKIQDGCDRRCTYCIIPFARGKSRSIPPDNLLGEAKILVNNGFKEIILTGIHIGRYGYDLTPKISLADLSKRLLKINGDFHLRLSSLDPDEINDEIIELLQDPRVCRHLHISLQSGSGNILKAMGRSSKLDDYSKVISLIVSKIPGIAIGTDVITGFPGESGSLFNETFEYLSNLPISYLHVFPYSARPGTIAAAMPCQVPTGLKKERVRLLKNLSQRKRLVFYNSQVGSELCVIITSKRADKNGFHKGVSDNYLTLLVKDEKIKYKDALRCRINEIVSKGDTIAAISMTQGEKKS